MFRGRCSCHVKEATQNFHFIHILHSMYRFLTLDLRKYGVHVFPLAFKTILHDQDGDDIPNDLNSLLSFKSMAIFLSYHPILWYSIDVERRHYLHIVLVVYHEGRFGALGLSRKRDLMDKKVSFEASTLLSAF